MTDQMNEQTEPIQEAVLIERGLYEQVVEGLYALDRLCAAHKIPDVDAHAVIYTLLTQLEAHRKEG
jgi:hypothetical protein